MTERDLVGPRARARNLAGGLVAASNLQREALVLDDESGGVAGVELVVEDGPRERRLERLGHEALERPRAVGGVEAAQRQLLDGVGFDLRVFAHMFGLKSDVDFKWVIKMKT